MIGKRAESATRSSRRFASARQWGALVMLSFGLGTLPHLFAGGMLLAAARRFVPTVALRYAGAALIAGFGLLGLGHAFGAHVTMTDLALCLVP